MYSLRLHRYRETGLAYHPQFRVLDWLDERPSTREEVLMVVDILGILDEDCSKNDDDKDHDVHNYKSWTAMCKRIGDMNNSTGEQRNLWLSWIPSLSQRRSLYQDDKSNHLKAFTPYNPIRKKHTPVINVHYMQYHGSKRRTLIVLWW